MASPCGSGGGGGRVGMPKEDLTMLLHFVTVGIGGWGRSDIVGVQGGRAG